MDGIVMVVKYSTGSRTEINGKILKSGTQNFAFNGSGMEKFWLERTQMILLRSLTVIFAGFTVPGPAQKCQFSSSGRATFCFV